MISQKTITFRSQTNSELGDLISDEGLECQPSLNLLSYLAGEVLNYKDEGVQISPTILFCGEGAAMLKAFPGEIRYEIGAIPLSANAGKRILKDCAPLTASNWSIYIERLDEKQIKYGVFTYSKLPGAIPIHRAVALSNGEFGVLLRRTSQNTVELVGAKGSCLTIVFSTMRDKGDAVSSDVFVTDCIADAEFGVPALPTEKEATGEADAYEYSVGKEAAKARVNLKEKFTQYMSTLFEDSLSKSHGTIIICAEAAKLRKTEQLKDGIYFDPPIDFANTFHDYEIFKSADAAIRLQSYEELLLGILNCDGIVAFNSSGAVIAYRVFFKSQGDDAEKSNEEKGEIVGGARRRAFEGLSSLVGKSLQSALFRSQDGHMIYKGAQK